MTAMILRETTEKVTLLLRKSDADMLRRVLKSPIPEEGILCVVTDAESSIDFCSAPVRWKMTVQGTYFNR